MKKKKKSMYPGGGHFKKKPNANMPKQQMKKGGKLKPVDKEKNPGLAKLPTDVRNKMGFMAMGGKMNADEDFMYGGKMMKKMAKGGTFPKGRKLDDKLADKIRKRFKGPFGSNIFEKAREAKFGLKKPKRRMKMMKGGKMNYPGGGMMKKGSMYPGGGRMQHD